MPETTITVAEIIAPQPGKKMWKIADSVGGQWQVWADKVQSYTRGMTYNIDYEVSNFKGTEYRTIKRNLGSTGGSPAPQQFTAQGATQQHGQRAAAPAPMTDPRGRDIFICGALNNTLSNQNVNPLLLNENEVRGLVDMFGKVWDDTHG